MMPTAPPPPLSSSSSSSSIFLLVIFFILLSMDFLRLSAAAPVLSSRIGVSKNQNKINQSEFEFLKKFGHVSRDHSERSISADELRRGIRSLQRMAQLNETGELDDATRDVMKKPRCGRSDAAAVAAASGRGSRRRKRFVFEGGKWPNTNLVCRFQSLPQSMDPDEAAATIYKAFMLWCQVIPCSFTMTYGPRGNCSILFAVGNHGDAFPFDGPGGVLSHTFPPDDGRMHFDDAEEWNQGSPNSGIDLRQVATHEGGHLLGLGHSPAAGSIMNPFYPGYRPNVELGADDIAGMQTLYGGPPPPNQGQQQVSSSSSSSPPPTTTTITRAQSSIASSPTTTASTTMSSPSSPSPTTNAFAIQVTKYTPPIARRNTPMRGTTGAAKQ